MAQNDFMSQEALKQLSQVLEDVKGLMDRQLEIAEKVLEHEHTIGKTRIGYLKSYFDTYSTKLQQVSTKQSKLGESFLVLQNQLENFEPGTEPKKGPKAKKNIRVKMAGVDDLDGRSGGSSGGGNGGNYNMDRGNLDPTDNDGPSAKKIKEASDARIAAEKIILEMRSRDRLNEQEQTRALAKKRADWENQLANMRMKNQNSIASRVSQLQESEMRLEALRHAARDKEAGQELIREQALSISVSNRQKVLNAEIDAQESLLKAQASIEYYTNPNNAQEIEALSNRETAAKYDQKDAIKKADALEKKKAQLELIYKRKNNGILRAEDEKAIQKQLAKQFKDTKKNNEAIAKHRANLVTIESEKANAAERDELRAGVGALTAKGASFAERKAALYDLTHDADGNVDQGKAISAALVAVSDMAKQLESKIDTIAGKKGAIDTRLQGSNNEKYAGSYWDQLVRDMTSVGAVNPYFKQEDFAKNIETLVSKGISFDLKQRAFLMTVSDKIASTFDVSNATLLRLVRIQQEDSTAGRLGMESALNSFLNEMYETSEYLESVASSVRSSLEEMESLMAGAEAAEVEYQVQKWLGSLYSVGMSDSAVNSISTALGQIAAGQIEGITNGGAGNLLIMAANDAGLSIADILTDGLDSKDTNKLLQAAVNYLAELSDSAADNKVVQQQLANVFGVKASDLRAATNLVLPGTTSAIYSNSMTYGNMLDQLAKMAGSMGSRTSVAEMMTNFWENGSYTLAGSMASNPVSYFIYKMASVVDDAAGGIDLPFLNVMGYGVDLNTTVSDLMRVAAVGGGILGSIGPMISGLGSSFSGRAMLSKLGIDSGSGLAVTPRGDGGGSTGSTGGGAASTSSSGYVGNSSGSDIKDSTIQESEDSKKQQMIEAKEEAEANEVDVLNQTVIKIYELLENVAAGKNTFKVQVEGYGLTKAGSGGAQGGVAGLGGSQGGSSGSKGLGVNSSGVSGSVDFGSWTTG